MVHMGFRGRSGESAFPFYLVFVARCFVSAGCLLQLSGPEPLGDSLVPTSHRSLGVLLSQTWVLETNICPQTSVAKAFTWRPKGLVFCFSFSLFEGKVTGVSVTLFLMLSVFLGFCLETRSLYVAPVA